MPKRADLLQLLPADDAGFDDLRLQLHLRRGIHVSGANHLSWHADMRRIHDLPVWSNLRRNSRSDLRTRTHLSRHQDMLG